MATLFDWGAPRPIEGGGAGGAATPSAPGSSQATSNTYFSNPDLVKVIAEALGGTVGGAAKSYADFAANPVASDTFQTQLKSLLSRLAPGEADARTALTDQFRAAG